MGLLKKAKFDMEQAPGPLPPATAGLGPDLGLPQYFAFQGITIPVFLSLQLAAFRFFSRPISEVLWIPVSKWAHSFCVQIVG